MTSNNLNTHRARYRTVLLTLAFMLLALHLLAFPRVPFTTQHDSSSAATFEYYAAKKVQFGTEMYQNIGPLGYVLYSDDYTGLLHWQKIILKNACRLGLLVLLGWLMSRLTSTSAKLCWFAGFFMFFPFGDASNKEYLDLHDNLAYMTIYLLGLWLLQDRDDRQFKILSLIGWFFLTFLSLNKNSFFVFACGIVLVITAQNLYRLKPLRAILGVLSVTVSLTVVWTLANQRLENLPDFIHGVFSFSSGYNEAMAIKTPLAPLLLGVLILLLFGFRITSNWWDSKEEFGKAIIEALFLFIVWKHGFVRSDEHMLILFYAALLLVIPVCYYNPGRFPVLSINVPSTRNWLRIGSCLAVYGFCLVSFYAIIHKCHYKPIRLWSHLRHNVSWLVSPLAETNEMDRLLGESKAANSLPAIKKIVGESSIDFFGFEPGYLLLNNLNYSQRPMPITFVAANRYLQQANERFYRNPATAPAFVLFQSGGIDNRLSLQDDALAWRALLETYQPAALEKGFLLLQRRENLGSSVHQYPVTFENTIRFGQSFPLVDTKLNALWLEVKVEHTFAGKLAALFYKTPQCTIGLQFEGQEEPNYYKFVTSMGDCGFMINPYLETVGDVARFYNPAESIDSFPKVSTLVFKHDLWDRIFFKDNIHVTLRLLERPQP